MLSAHLAEVALQLYPGAEWRLGHLPELRNYFFANYSVIDAGDARLIPMVQGGGTVFIVLAQQSEMPMPDPVEMLKLTLEPVDVHNGVRPTAVGVVACLPDDDEGAGMDEIRVGRDDGDETVSTWMRVFDDESEQMLRGVNATLVDDLDTPWPWQVGCSVAEFVREEPLEGELRRGIDQALRQVEGVTDVTEEDREVWVVAGSPKPEDLVRAAARVVDALEPRVAALLDLE